MSVNVKTDVSETEIARPVYTVWIKVKH